METERRKGEEEREEEEGKERERGTEDIQLIGGVSTDTVRSSKSRFAIDVHGQQRSSPWR